MTRTKLSSSSKIVAIAVLGTYICKFMQITRSGNLQKLRIPCTELLR